MELLAPDGYYHYLGIEKPKPAVSASSSSVVDDKQQQQQQQQQQPFLHPNTTTTTTTTTTINVDQVKKNYRKLSLRHHPDKPGGDVETFRLLNRAQKVLMHPVLRQQYDILGIDLDDDDDDDDAHHHHHHAAAAVDRHDNENNNKEEKTSTAQGIVQEIASMALTSILQLGVRTGT